MIPYFLKKILGGGHKFSEFACCMVNGLVSSDIVISSGNTVKFLNFRTPKNFAVINLKFKQRGQTEEYFVKKTANGIANSEDPDQTAPKGAV